MALLLGQPFEINDFYTCFTHFPLTVNISTNRGLPSPSTDGVYLGYRSRAPYIYAHALALSAKIRMRAMELLTGVAYRGNFRISQSRLLKASKDHVRPVSKRLCIIFMACSCPNFVLGRLKKKKKKRKKKMEKISVFPFSVYNSGDVF